MKWKEKWERAVAAWNNRGYTCDFCGCEVFSYPQFRLCDGCERAMTQNQGYVCPKCGTKTVAEGVCASCKSLPPAFERGRSPLVYFDETARLINRFKNGSPYLANYLAEKMLPQMQEFLREDGELFLVAVPLTKKKRRMRGYNQAEELAKALARLTGVRYEKDVIVKLKDNVEQKKLSAKERREWIVGTYRVHKRKLCEGKTIVVVDDIMTTATTGSECARILYRVGAKRVFFLTACSTPERVLKE